MAALILFFSGGVHARALRFSDDRARIRDYRVCHGGYDGRCYGTDICADGHVADAGRFRNRVDRGSRVLATEHRRRDARRLRGDGPSNLRQAAEYQESVPGPGARIDELLGQRPSLLPRARGISERSDSACQRRRRQQDADCARRARDDRDGVAELGLPHTPVRQVPQPFRIAARQAARRLEPRGPDVRPVLRVRRLGGRSL